MMYRNRVAARRLALLLGLLLVPVTGLGAGEEGEREEPAQSQQADRAFAEEASDSQPDNGRPAADEQPGLDEAHPGHHRRVHVDAAHAGRDDRR